MTPDTGDYVLAKRGSVYVVYRPQGGGTDLDLEDETGTFAVAWYDPRAGGALKMGSVAEVTGPGSVSLGDPPSGGDDWVALVRHAETTFRRGDANGDAALDIADAIFLLAYLFAEGPWPGCLDSADANDEGTLDIADAITILGNLFSGTGSLPAPFETCGVDPTPDDLGCTSFPGCP